MELPGILVFLLTTAAALPYGPTFRGYFDNAFPFQEVAARIASWTPESKSNVWELSGQHEGDIMLHPEQQQGSAKNILLNEDSRWPDAVLPYYIDPVFSEAEQKIIKGALNDFNENSCVKLVPYKDEKKSFDDKNIIRKLPEDDSTRDLKTFNERKKPASFIWIQGEETGCWSMVGRQQGKGSAGSPDEEEEDYLDTVEVEDAGEEKKRKKRSWLEELGLGFLFGKDKEPGAGGQVVNLQRPGCVHHGVVVHEVLHALGFFHQQSSYNRDEFVRIQWENISEGKESNFNKYNSSVVTDFGVAYDYSSVMHYGRTAFSKNGNDTIVPLKKNAVIGLRGGMSKGDVAKLIKAYCEDNEE